MKKVASIPTDNRLTTERRAREKSREVIIKMLTKTIKI